MEQTPVEIIVVVERGCCREVYSLGVPIKYHVLEFDDQSEEEPVIHSTYDAEVVPGTLSDTILVVKEKYL